MGGGPQVLFMYCSWVLIFALMGFWTSWDFPLCPVFASSTLAFLSLAWGALVKSVVTSVVLDGNKS